MSYIILASELVLFTGVSLKIAYSKWQTSKALKPAVFSPENRNEALLDLQSIHGYNEHSLVGISPKRKAWFDEQTNSALNYSEHGKMWMVAGETLAADENLLSSTRRFLQAAQNKKRVAAFLPVTEKFARAISVATGMKAVKIGASPCFDLQNWNPRGNKSKSLRAGLSQARRQQISFEVVAEIGEDLRLEVAGLCKGWLQARSSVIKFGWLFELSPFQNADKKKFFTARDAGGKLVGFLAASPIPARDGWYLEDVLRASDAPNGTAEILVFETMKLLAAQGAKFATLGTAPLAADGEDNISTDGNVISRQIMKFCRSHLNSIYNFKGIRNFKAKFVPSYWESEYVLVPKGLIIPLLVVEALIYIVIQEK